MVITEPFGRAAGPAAAESGSSPAVVPLNQVSVMPESMRLLEQVCASGMLAQGPLVAEVEAAFAAVCGTRHCVAVSNGTVALSAAMMAVGVGPGTTVVTTPFTFIATVNAALALGARVRFADIRDDYTLDPDALAAAVDADTRAVVPVHLYGLVADMPAINAVAERVGAAVIEDAAQAHGARLARRPAGSWGVAGTFSLYGTKNVAAGEGGLITTDDDDIADALRVLRNQGMRSRYEYGGWGTNWRWSDLHAAIALPQIHHLATINQRRRRNAELLTAGLLSAGLADIDGLRLPSTPQGAEPVWHQYTVEVLPASGITRDELATRLRERGIASGVYYPQALPDVPHLRHSTLVESADVPVARRVAGRVLSLPVGHHVTEGEIARVVDAVRTSLRGRS